MGFIVYAVSVEHNVRIFNGIVKTFKARVLVFFGAVCLAYTRITLSLAFSGVDVQQTGGLKLFRVLDCVQRNRFKRRKKNTFCSVCCLQSTAARLDVFSLVGQRRAEHIRASGIPKITTSRTLVM